MKNRPTHPRRRGGMVLIVTLGLLTILALLATTFVTLTRVERDTASNYVLDARARMLAHSGVEYALAMFRTAAGASPRALYGGEDWDGKREPIGSPDGTADDVNGNGNGKLDVTACALRCARRPSFFADADGDGLPDLVSIAEGGATVQRGYSGRVNGTFTKDSDTFVVDATDTSALLYLNGAGAGYRRLYDNFGTLAFAPPIAALGTAIQAKQPYSTPDELVAKGVLTAAQFDAVKLLLTVHAWEDRSVIKPDPQANLLVRPENLRRLTYLEPRAPLNVNTADFVLLKAAFLGISGYETDNNTPTKSAFVLDATRADNLAAAIVLAREETYTDANGNGRYDAGEPFVDLNSDGNYDGPFRTWEQFRAFLPSVAGFVGNFNTWARDLVQANANPNSLLNKFQPDHHRWRVIDKSDLIVYTTEFTFEGTGTYRIRSLGRITDANLVTVAEKELETDVKMFDIARLTTQEDFEAAQIKVSMSPDVMTLPEEIAEVVPESYVDVNGDLRFSKGDTFTDANGDGMRDGPAIYDGQLTLRPADPPDLPPWGDDANLAFRCLITDSPNHNALGPDLYPGFTADVATPGASAVPLNAAPLTTNVDVGGSLLRDLTGANDYPDLFPDGLFVRKEYQETVYWSSLLNWPVGQGSVGFWVKPTWYSIPASILFRDLMVLNQNYQKTPARGRLAILYAVAAPPAAAPSPGQFRMFSFWYDMGWITAANQFADDSAYNPAPWEMTLYTYNYANRWGPGQWHYFSCRYTQQIRWECFLDAMPFSTLIEAPYDKSIYYTLVGVDVTHNHIGIGSNGPWYDTLGSGTYDDFRVWTSQVPTTTVGLAPVWRFDDTGFAGYSQYVGQFRLPAGAKVRTLAWTEYRPTQNYRGEALSSTSATPRRRRPDVSLSYKLSSEAGAFRPSPALATPDSYDGGSFDADPAMPALSATDTLRFRFLWDRKGEDPFRNSPAVDDVTVTYTTGGFQFLTWTIQN